MIYEERIGKSKHVMRIIGIEENLIMRAEAKYCTADTCVHFV